MIIMRTTFKMIRSTCALLFTDKNIQLAQSPTFHALSRFSFKKKRFYLARITFFANFVAENPPLNR